jgi:hypothetical protein
MKVTAFRAIRIKHSNQAASAISAPTAAVALAVAGYVGSRKRKAVGQ